MSLAIRKSDWQLCLPDSIDTDTASVADIVASMIVCKVGNFEQESCRPIMFSMILTDGNSILFNQTVGELGNDVMRMHLPFKCIKRSYHKPPVVAPEFDFQNVGLEELVNLCDKADFKNSYDEEFRDAKDQNQLFGFQSCFTGLFGTGVIYELDDEDRTVILPFTSSMRDKATARFESDKIEVVVIEDVIELMSDSTNIEGFSFNILKSIAAGAIYIPDDPLDINGNNFGDDDIDNGGPDEYDLGDFDEFK